MDDAYTITQDYIGHYTITDNATGRNIYLQGDDARQFRQDLARIDHIAKDEQRRQTLICGMCSAYYA